MILQRDFRIRAPIATTIAVATRITGTEMNERQERLAREREEIALHVAHFKATQEKFRREREQYYIRTLQNACSGSAPRSQDPFCFDGLETGL